MDTHKLLTDYHTHPQYPTIAKMASQWVKANPAASEPDLLAHIAGMFEPAFVLEPNKKAAPLAMFGEAGTHIPHGAVDQIYTALKLPVATAGALMPDAHVGYALPIGGVIALERAVSPSFVGYDISCMVQLSILDISIDDFERHREAFAKHLLAETSFGLGADFKTGRREHAIEFDSRWEATRDIKSLHPKAMTQLGSSGGGNHFADLLTVTFDEDFAAFKAGDTAVGLMTHSGSRGTGHKLATLFVKRAEQYIRHIARQIPKGYEWLSLDDDVGKEYWLAMELMGDYAKANHDLIHQHFTRSANLQVRHTVWNRHNYAWLEGDSVIHRKGATPAETDRLGIIPGTSGTASYLVRGLGNPASLNSSSHGAGRWISRTQAKKNHNETAYQKHMSDHDILHFGLSSDETYQAYKDIEMVMGLQDDLLIKRIARLTPRVVIMGGQADDGD